MIPTITVERTSDLASNLLSDLKGHLRITGTAEDTELTRYLQKAIYDFEDATCRLLVAATVLEYWDFWPWYRTGVLELARSPVTSFTSVKYYDVDAVQQTWDSGNYQTDLLSEPARVRVEPDATVTNPALDDRMNPVVIEYESGLAATYDVIPADAVNAVFVMAAHLYSPGREIGYGNDKAVQRCWWSAIRRHQWRV